MNSDLVRYVCREKAHLEASRGGTPTASPVTIHGGTWAYCPAGAGAPTDHVWEEIEPVTLANLRLSDSALPREATAD